MMIEANIRILSRMELLYTCISKFAIYVHKQDRDDLLTGLEEYCDPNNFNRMFYYSKPACARRRIFTVTMMRLWTDCQRSFRMQTCYSDSRFSKDSLERKEFSDEEAIVVTDGAYFGGVLLADCSLDSR